MVLQGTATACWTSAGKIGRSERGPGAKQHGPFDQIAQFPHVAGQGIATNKFARWHPGSPVFSAKADRVRNCSARIPLLPSRRGGTVGCHHKAKVQIFTKLSLATASLQIPIRRNNHHAHGRSGSHRPPTRRIVRSSTPEGSFACNRQRQVADFVEKDRPLGHLQQAAFLRRSPR